MNATLSHKAHTTHVYTGRAAAAAAAAARDRSQRITRQEFALDVILNPPATVVTRS